MKKLITLLSAAFLTTAVLAQAPDKMSYQASIRNASNSLVISHQVGMRISILQGSAVGTAVYVETQTPTTNTNGLVSIEIGAGSVVTGTFSGINWGSGPYFIKTETDPTGGTSYTITGTSQLLSIPYALYAKTAGSATITAGSITNTQIASNAAIAISKLNTSGTATTSNFLRGDGSWATATAAQGIVVYTGTTGGTSSQTISDLNIRTVIVTFNGGSGAASTIALTIPSAASYSAGTMLSISVSAYATANPSWSITSPGSAYSALNFNTASMAGGVSVGATNGFRIISDGVSNWYRVLGQ